MAEEGRKVDDVDKFLSEAKGLEDRKQALIADLLKQKAAAIKAFDDRLAKLGFHANSSGKSKRSHHKKTAKQSPSDSAVEERRSRQSLSARAL